jgi:hypothetical protein
MDQPLYLAKCLVTTHPVGPPRRSTTSELNLLLLSNNKRQEQPMNENEEMVE